jgi:hypothetical protein
MESRCIHYPEAGPNEADGAQMCGLCPDCRDHDVVSYFCSEDCYRENVVSTTYFLSHRQMLMHHRKPIGMNSITEGISPTLARLLIDSKPLWMWRLCPRVPRRHSNNQLRMSIEA